MSFYEAPSSSLGLLAVQLGSSATSDLQASKPLVVLPKGHRCPLVASRSRECFSDVMPWPVS
ncbi:hypothetical protein [Oryza sativa Japonica Group]|uniref:Uncharacterized protein n=1 Tax=Oryza sativa subsp. japonica TaxID=39947 RepID=Q5JNS6_ORYSJ|nr:hypothetical protein [Oryza sativa Japonica Group]